VLQESGYRRRLTLTLVALVLAIAVVIMMRRLHHSSNEITSTPTGSAAIRGLTNIPRELTIASAQKIFTLDPDLAADGYSEGIVHLIGGTLFERGAGEVRPLLVASKLVSPDGLTWTFELKPGLKFSDGTALTSKDVQATFERIKDDKLNVYVGFVAPIQRIIAMSPTQIIMQLSRPYPSLPIILSQPEMSIFPIAGLARGKAFFDWPVSAGAYKLLSWGGSAKAVLVRNPNYAGAAPAVEQLTYQTIEDFNARYAEVLSGKVDVATDIPSRMLAHSPGSVVAAMTPRYGFITLPFNVHRTPLNEVGVRKAIAKAIDRKQINRTVWQGRSTPIAEFWPSTMSGYDRRYSIDRDIAGAKRDLKGTSCEAGCAVRFTYSPVNPWSEPIATVVAQNLLDIGIRIQMERVDDATFNARLDASEFEIAVSFVYDYNDVPDGLLTYALTADGGLRANFTGFQPTPDIERAVKQAMTQDGVARWEALADINALFCQYQPFVTLSDYAVGSISRYAPSVVKINSAGFLDVAGGQP
jgi:peptide/nickel transport system substrate-binding protein